MKSNLSPIIELHRRTSPVATPQALAWRDNVLWLSSRDEQRLVSVDPQSWTEQDSVSTPGVLWGGVAWDRTFYFIRGEGAADDRYLCRYEPDRGFDESYHIALPEFTGSYLSHDGEHLYVSQWYKQRVLQLDPEGSIVRTIDIGAEICGHAFVGSFLYVLRGTERDGESWQVARLDPGEKTPLVEDLAHVPFACRSLAFEGGHFWTNHRANHETVSFDLPDQ